MKKIELRESMTEGKYEKNGELFNWYYLGDQPIGDLLFADAKELGIQILLDGNPIESSEEFKKLLNKSKRISVLNQFAK